MKQYQVTKKLQVTIPKRLASKVGIRPGDSVVFEETDGTIMLRKAGAARDDAEEVRRAVEEFAREVQIIKPQIRKAEAALVEGLSRHVASK